MNQINEQELDLFSKKYTINDKYNEEFIEEFLHNMSINATGMTRSFCYELQMQLEKDGFLIEFQVKKLKYLYHTIGYKHQTN